jgi:SAM-dependent methyltransferase
MSTAARHAHPEAWGTRRWFAERFAAADSDDPSAYFGHRVSGYQQFRHRRLLGLLQRRLPDPPRSLLDLGCGTGCLTALLAERLGIADARGTDFVEGALQLAASQFPQLRFRASSLPNLPYEGECFDLIVASEVLYYLTADDQRACLRQIAARLPAGGHLLLTTRLGAGYFTAEQAAGLLAERFEIIDRETLRTGLYQTLTRPWQAVTAVDSALRNDRLASGEGRRDQWIQRHRRWLHRRPVRMAVAAASRCGRPILGTTGLPRAAHALETALRRSPSNLMILARRRG